MRLQFDPGTIEEFFRHSPDAIAVHQKGTLLYVNLAGLDLVGANSPDDVLGRNVLDFVHPESRELVVKRLGQSAGGERGPLVEEGFLRLDGSRVDVEVAALPITVNGEAATVLVIRDVTRRKQTEAENARLLAEARAALEEHRFATEALTLAEEAAGLGIWAWDVKTNALRWTPGLAGRPASNRCTGSAAANFAAPSSTSST